MNVATKPSLRGDGREITIETGKLAKQADGSVVRMGNTMSWLPYVQQKMQHPVRFYATLCGI